MAWQRQLDRELLPALTHRGTSELLRNPRQLAGELIVYESRVLEDRPRGMEGRIGCLLLCPPSLGAHSGRGIGKFLGSELQARVGHAADCTAVARITSKAGRPALYIVAHLLFPILVAMLTDSLLIRFSQLEGRPMRLRKRTVGVAICVCIIFGSVLVWSLWKAFPGADGQTLAAWFQAVGSIGAILAAFLVGQQQSRAALQAVTEQQRERRESIVAVAGAAAEHARRIGDALERDSVGHAEIYNVYDQTIVNGMVHVRIPAIVTGYSAGT